MADEVAAAEEVTTQGGETQNAETKVETQTTQTAETKTEETKAAETQEKAKETVVTAEEKPKVEEKPYWPEDWREKAAAHVAAGDKKAYERELKRLERMTDPTALYGTYRELEAKFGKGGLIRIPDEKADEKEVAEFRKAMGYPEKPEEFVDRIELEEGLVLGDDEKETAKSFAEAVHSATTPQEFVNKAVNWQLQNRIQALEALDERDENFRTESEAELKEEFGGSYNRNRNAIASLFTSAPGGSDPGNPESLMSQILTGRTADGNIIGNDPRIVRWLAGLAREVNPAATVIDMGKESTQNIETEIKQIKETMRKDRRAYDKDPAMQQRYRELLAAQEGIQRRAS